MSGEVVHSQETSFLAAARMQMVFGLIPIMQILCCSASCERRVFKRSSLGESVKDVIE